MKCPCHNPESVQSSEPFSDHLGTGELEYTRTPCNVRHAGQLKLLCSEIMFLTRFRGVPHTVIYAGAAPGLHIPRLARMFPEMHFVLVDPQPSAVRDPSIEVIRGIMTDSLATEFAERFGSNTLFVSDVRTGPASPQETSSDHQSRIQRDMVAQMGWHLALNPVASILKFRLPWDLEPHTHYLDGEICLPVFGRHLTHEARLIVTRGATQVDYDNRRCPRLFPVARRVSERATGTSDRWHTLITSSASPSTKAGDATTARPSGGSYRPISAHKRLRTR